METTETGSSDSAAKEGKSEEASDDISKETSRDEVETEAVIDDQIRDICQKITGKIISGEMNDREKITAVYEYVFSIGYSPVNYGDIEDVPANAYNYFLTHIGDCLCSYALTEVLLDYLGYETRLAQSDVRWWGTRHYWNQVRLPGDETWYNVDSTYKDFLPDGSSVCLVTDEDLARLCQEVVELYDWYEGYIEKPVE